MKILFLIFFPCILSLATKADVRLPALIRDSMILQRDSRIRIWGWADDGEKITIQINARTLITKASKDGKWSVWLSPIKAGGPYTMTVAGKNKILLKDIYFGDVWFCAGQSNMVHQLSLHNITYANDIATSNYPLIRHFAVPAITDLQAPREQLPVGYWKPAVPAHVQQFSAVAFFFARKLFEKYHVPIGLINSSVGGTPIEAWTSEEGLQAFPLLRQTITRQKDTALVNGIIRDAAMVNAKRPSPVDQGLLGNIKWFDTSYVPQGWRAINVPGYWEDQGIRDLNGIVWYRKIVDVPASFTAAQARVFLGRIVDADLLYINGVLVGNTGYQYPQRRYAVLPGILRAGRNLIVVKVINNSGKGGFVPDKPYYIEAGGQRIDLKGEWQYKVGAAFDAFKGSPSLSLQNQPTALFNGMVAPLTNYAIKGILWYQGESNISNAGEYAQLLPSLIHDWRKKWNNESLPFLFVQLPNFQEMDYYPSESNWALLREAQLKALSVHKTGMAVAIDLGEWNDIHPDNKKDVGERLALSAERIAYGERLVHSGPLPDSVIIHGGRITVRFNNSGSGLMTKDGNPPAEFAIAGADKKFFWAHSSIVDTILPRENGSVVLWNENVPNPLYVRYAWSDNPVNPNLYNAEGLPASPFRTDE